MQLKPSLRNEVWQSLCCNCISIATFCSLPGASVGVRLARAALLASKLLSYLCPASSTLSGKSNTLNGERKHYHCNRTWNEISVSPITTTFLNIFAVMEKPFSLTPVSAVFMISLEWKDDKVLLCRMSSVTFNYTNEEWMLANSEKREKIWS